MTIKFETRKTKLSKIEMHAGLTILVWLLVFLLGVIHYGLLFVVIFGLGTWLGFMFGCLCIAHRLVENGADQSYLQKRE